MDRHDRLYENYEDALFSLLMDRVAQEEGARLLEENERLRNDPDAAVPEELHRRSRETIRRAFSARRHPRHTAGWYLGRIAVAILAALLLFVVVYASSPIVRVKTLEALINVSDVSSKLSLVSSGEIGDKANSSRQTLAGYTLPDISRTYAVVDQGEDNLGAWITYSREDSSSMRIYIGSRESNYLDSEGANAVVEISIHGYSGVLLQNGPVVYISWYDSDNDYFILMYVDGVDRSIAMSYAEQIVFIN